MPIVLRVLIPVAIVVIGYLGYAWLSIEPERAKRPKGKSKPIKTRVEELRVGDFTPVVRTRGVVRPHDEVPLTPQVAGRIVRVHPGFEDGSFFAEGDVLVELDPQDFETAVVAAKAQLARAESVYAQESARAQQAKLNWEDLGYDEEPNALVLRLPQLNEAEANVSAAKAQLEQAERNRERAKVRAPFDGRVRQRNVGLGQSVGSGTPLGTVFAIDYAEVRLPIPSRDMKYLQLPEDPGDPTVDVELRDALGDDTETVWRGTIVRTEGALDADSLDLFAIARVEDPFGRGSDTTPLRIGQPVLAAIQGRVLEDVIVVPRLAVRQLSTVVLIDPQELTLQSHTVKPVWADEEFLVIRDSSIANGTLIATTNLVYAPNGSKVEVLPDSEPSGSSDGVDEGGASSAEPGSPEKSDKKKEAAKRETDSASTEKGNTSA